MSDRAAYALALAILAAGAMIAAAVTLRPAGRYALDDGTLLDTANGELRGSSSRMAPDDLRWEPVIAPVGTPPP